MKNTLKYFLLGMFGLIALLSSCNECDDEDNSITGIWKFSKQGTVIDGIEVLTDYSGNEVGCFRDRINLFKDGTIVFTDYDSSVTACEKTNTNGIWNKNGNTLTFQMPSGDVRILQILKLSSFTLKLKDPDGNIDLLVR